RPAPSQPESPAIGPEAGAAAVEPFSSRAASAKTGNDVDDRVEGAGAVDGFIPTPLQEAALQALDGKAVALDCRAEKLHTDRSAVHRMRRHRATKKWVRVTDAAEAAGCDRGIITRAVDAGALKSNGKSRGDRRIDAADLTRWMLARAEKPARQESAEAVLAKMERAKRTP